MAWQAFLFENIDDVQNIALAQETGTTGHQPDFGLQVSNDVHLIARHPAGDHLELADPIVCANPHHIAKAVAHQHGTLHHGECA